MHRIIFIFISLLLISGCASNRLYQWGDYEKSLYSSYKDQTKFEEMKVELEAHINTLEQSGQKVPPGLYTNM